MSNIKISIMGFITGFIATFIASLGLTVRTIEVIRKFCFEMQLRRMKLYEEKKTISAS